MTVGFKDPRLQVLGQLLGHVKSPLLVRVRLVPVLDLVLDHVRSRVLVRIPAAKLSPTNLPAVLFAGLACKTNAYFEQVCSFM